MDTNLEPFFQERLQHRWASGDVARYVRNDAARGHIEAFAIKPSWPAGYFVHGVVWIAAIRQCDELARRRIHRFEAIRTEPCVCWGD
jgi:hypothetical protein